MEKRRKTYSIRPNSPADFLINTALPIAIACTIIAAIGIMTSWDMGLL